ncbi:MAG: translesion error-prone DNA polymerase V autoproteolytic subunit [Victivallales bacterium]|nr:translesion error-prone DNA polymerase V autoproteolytic subunit [Victivallales bacterium]
MFYTDTDSCEGGVCVVAGESVCAGFPSPAEGYMEGGLDLNEHVVRHPTSTFFIRVRGDSMLGAGIFSGDLLVVDRSLTASDGSIVLAVLDGEFTVKRLRRSGGAVELVAENPDFSGCVDLSCADFRVWGVVTHSIRSFVPRRSVGGGRDGGTI